jgi:hypothetical protein
MARFVVGHNCKIDAIMSEKPPNDRLTGPTLRVQCVKPAATTPDESLAL